jgi:hypothetical protein
LSGNSGNDDLVWETSDPDGRRVLLTGERWTHVLDRHPYIGVAPKEIVDIVSRPDAWMHGPEEGEEWFYRGEAGPSRWIRVVVHYEENRGFVVTAFPRRRYP